MNSTNATQRLLEKIDPEVALDLTKRYLPGVLAAAVILVIAFTVAHFLGNLLGKALERQKLEPPARNLIVRILRLFIFAFGLILALDNLGLSITPLVAGIGVAGVGIGFAMQGVLANLIAGIFLTLSKPFRVGEYIELLGVEGQVVGIELFATHLAQPDQSKIVIPNRKIVGEIMHNYGSIRQLKLEISVAYGTDIPLAISQIREVLDEHRLILKEPASGVGIASLGQASVVLGVHTWASVANYPGIRHEIYQSLLIRFAKAHIEMPRPQYEIRILETQGLSQTKLGAKQSG
ncbi:MAG: mechanosensitive ion channel [Verrucomicrobia bacterium]|nr:mechanosensitive ion channel [Verrucomicrobiota bacterium]